MSEPKQSCQPKHLAKSTTHQQIEYCAPPEEVVEDFTRAVCDKLGEADKGDLTITQMRQGFGSFLKTMITMTAKEANSRRDR